MSPEHTHAEKDRSQWAIVGLAFAGEINDNNRPVYDGRLHVRHDQRLYPPFNPLPAVVEGDRIVRLLVHENDRDEDALVAKAAERYDLPTGTVR